ncbi:MAG: YXWGXW repeat-containing protein [Bacteroidetes bacterium]|nr:YXWGXW repeat-containing protein [Bacteroidota bacterium]MBS1590721.1 YXWGXW repeat-containing protein [Bacteroidota bacterium]
MKNIFRIIVIVLAAVTISTTTQAQVSVGLSINIAPPAIPVYAQPPCPVDGYLWTPGYWAYGVDGYYWVPGVWIAPPRMGYLWTPGYWAFIGGFYRWHVGYWGLHIGYYGGINYGFGYGGVGFVGGMWQGNVFRYNTAVVNVNTTVVRNTYINKTVINNTTTINNNHYSFNGQGGVTASPNREEEAAMKEQHLPATATQFNHENTARNNKAQYFSANNGKPHSMAMDKIGGSHFNERGEQVMHNNRKMGEREIAPRSEGGRQKMAPYQPQQRKQEIRNSSKEYKEYNGTQKRRDRR